MSQGMASGDKGMSSALASLSKSNPSFSKAMNTIHSAGESAKGSDGDGDNAAVVGAPIERVTLVFVTLAALAAAGAVVL